MSLTNSFQSIRINLSNGSI